MVNKLFLAASVFIAAFGIAWSLKNTALSVGVYDRPWDMLLLVPMFAYVGWLSAKKLAIS